MGLSCSCNYDDDIQDGTIYWCEMADYVPLQTKRRRRCCSCKEMINIGDLCCEVKKARTTKNEVEWKIYGEGAEILTAPAHMCERCADIANSLSELGYCDEPWEDQRKRAKEYAHEHSQAKK